MFIKIGENRLLTHRFFFSLALQPPWALDPHFLFHDLFTDGRLLGRVISSSQGLYLNTGQHKHRINTYTYQTYMPCMGFETTIPASERAKTVHNLDRSATVTGNSQNCLSQLCNMCMSTEAGNITKTQPLVKQMSVITYLNFFTKPLFYFTELVTFQVLTYLFN
jgi:hypothetical protein